MNGDIGKDSSNKSSKSRSKDVRGHGIYRTRSGHQKIAQERIESLLSQAKEQFTEDKELSKRYVALARKLSTRYKVRLSPDQKRMFCKRCNTLLKQGINSRTRLEHGKIVITCLECNAVKRAGYRKRTKDNN